MSLLSVTDKTWAEHPAHHRLNSNTGNSQNKQSVKVTQNTPLSNNHLSNTHLSNTHNYTQILICQILLSFCQSKYIYERESAEVIIVLHSYA